MFGRKPKTNDTPDVSGDDTWTNSDASYDQTAGNYDTDVIPDHTAQEAAEVNPPARPATRGRQPLLLGLGITALLVMAGAGAYLALSPSRSNEMPGSEAGVITEPAPQPTPDTEQPLTEEPPTQITAQPTPEEEAITTPAPSPASEQPAQTGAGMPGTQMPSAQTPVTQAPGQQSPKEGDALASGTPPEKRSTTVRGDPFRLLVNTNGEQIAPQVTGSDTTPASLRGDVQPVSVAPMNAPLITAPPISVQTPTGQVPTPVTVNQVSATPTPVTQSLSVKPVQISPAQTTQEPLPGPRAEVIMVPPVSQSGVNGPAQQGGNTAVTPPQELPTPITPKPPTAKEIAQASLASYVSSQAVQYVGFIAGETPQAVLNISGQELVLGVGDPIPGTRVTLRRADGQKASLTMDSVSTELPIAQTGGTQ